MCQAFESENFRTKLGSHVLYIKNSKSFGVIFEILLATYIFSLHTIGPNLTI
jgi:hypothetical protein